MDCVTAYIFGYCLCWLNILVWISYFDKYPPSGGSARVSWGSLRTTISDTRGRILSRMQLILIPVAFLMSVGPLFVPFAALPLAQQVKLHTLKNDQLLTQISVAMDSLL